MESTEMKETGCCPPFEPGKWEDKMFQWENKHFIRDKVCTIFFMPLNFGQVMKRLDKKTTEAGVLIPENLCLSDHPTKWKMNVSLAVDKEVPGAENFTLSGKFYSKVYEGSYQNTGKWCKDYESVAAAKGLKIKKMYMWYTTCPKCAKQYGKNYTVIISQVEE